MDNTKAGDQETNSLGRELAAKSQMIKEGQSDSTSAAAPAAKAAPKTDTGKRYGDKSGEKRIDVRDALKPLGSFKHGTDYVPKTGIYKLHEGEGVTPKEENTMNAVDAMAGLASKAKPPKKIHKITTHKTDDGKMIHTHQHHHPSHHPDETHVSNNIGEANDHMTAMEPNMSAQPPAMPEAGAPAAGPMPTPGM